MDDTSETYAVLGATGNCGSALINIILHDKPKARINAYCRNRSKLLKKMPDAGSSDRVEIFEGGIQDTQLLAKCVAGSKAVFLCVSTNDNIPGCRLSQDTTISLLKALRELEELSAKLDHEHKLPKVVLLSSGTVDETFSQHVPALLLPILLRSASYVYKDIVEAEKMLRAEQDWLTSIYVKPGALSVDTRRGFALSLTEQHGPTSYLDLAAGMLAAVDDEQRLYDGKSVSLICTNGAAQFPKGTAMCILSGLLRHYFPWMHSYLPSDTVSLFRGQRSPPYMTVAACLTTLGPEVNEAKVRSGEQ